MLKIEKNLLCSRGNNSSFSFFNFFSDVLFEVYGQQKYNIGSFTILALLFLKWQTAQNEENESVRGAVF